MKKWLWKLTGGRPMLHIRDHFTDIVSGKMVSDYMDRNGKYWMAEHKWAWFRVPLRGAQIMDALQNRKPQFNEMAWATVRHSDGTYKREYVPLSSAEIMKMFDEARAAIDLTARSGISSGDEH